MKTYILSIICLPISRFWDPCTEVQHIKNIQTPTYDFSSGRRETQAHLLMKYNRDMYQPTTTHSHEISSESGDFEEDGDDDDFLEDDEDDDDDVSNKDKLN